MRALERTYECARCGARALAEVDVEPGALRVDDGMGIQHEASRTLGLIRCPSCGERERLAVPWTVIRAIAYAVVGTLVALLATGGAFGGAIAMVAFPLFLIAGGAVEVRRWRSASRVRLQEVKHPPAQLPTAIARPRRDD